MSNNSTIAGMSLGGGKKENFFFCLIEFYEKENRWFLKSLNQVKEESNLTNDEVITTWVEGTDVKKMVVDFPLTRPPCETCQLVCPGTELCHNEEVIEVREKMAHLLGEDKALIETNPKRYEQERVEDDKVHYSKSVLSKATDDHILSKSFKRKLKKGFIPYWNRPIDFWIWKHYYDQMLNLFNISFDSFGNVSVMLMHKFNYLLRHLPRDLNIMESDVHICLIELYRAGIITKNNLMDLKDIELSALARIQIAKQIEKKLNVFIYEKDLELISKNPKAFDSFLLAIIGRNYILGQLRETDQVEPRNSFIVPSFA